MAGARHVPPCALGRRWLSGSAVAKLQLYDPGAGRRPQMEVKWRDARITALVPDHSGEWAVQQERGAAP